jgi:hypothetical protein
MSTHATSGPVAAGQQSTTRVTGLARFAGVLLIISGLWGVLAGISGILADKIFVTTPQYVYYFDITAWGWVHLILGVLVAGAGIGVLKGTAWGRILGVALASASLLVNFAFIPHYPIWSILIIALDVLIIWQLASQPWGED